jgi:hypothetical protein
MNAMTRIQLLNIATTRRNIARRQGNTKLAVWWEAQARYCAQVLNTRLVSMPGRPGAVIAEIFVGILPE